MKVCIAILNYNGEHLLKRFLPSVVAHSEPYEVAVIDNGSTDNSIIFLKDNYPAIKIVELKDNYGFAGGYNKGLKLLSADIFVLLNSDVEVTPNWVEPIATLFKEDSTIAAVQPKIKDLNNKERFEYAGAAGGFVDKYGFLFSRGRIFDALEDDINQYQTTEVFWASGACFFVKASVFNNLQGFDEDLFAHMEEVDLCWRIKRSGYKVLVCSESTIYHLGGGTLNKLNAKKTFLNFRNNLLILLKNYKQSSLLPLLFTRMIFDGLAAYKLLFEGKPSHFFAIAKAHFSFYWYFAKFYKKRKQLFAQFKDFDAKPTGWYNKSIVIDHFKQKIDRFSMLNPKDFN
jgi:GT2 family glycosyltransferase